MGTVIVLSSEAVMALINNAVTGATITGGGELVLQKPGGVTVNLGNVTDHGELIGISDDDHTQYALSDGTRGDFATEAQGALADAARPNVRAVIDVNGGDANGWVEQVTVTDDNTATSGWVDRFIGFFRHRVSGAPVADNLRRRVHWRNEYQELRLAPAKENTVALRIFVRDTATTQTNARDANVPLLQMMDDRGVRTPIWGLYPNGKVRVASQEIETAHVLLLGPTDPVPTGTPAGTVIVRTT